MSLILKQEPANTIATPPAGKSTLFITDTSTMAVKDPSGNVTTFPTVQGSNTQVFFNDSGAINGNASLVFNKTTSTMTVANLSVTGTLNAGDISVSSIANGTSNVDIVGVSGNVTTSVNGTANVIVISATGATITGNLSTTGNINAGNISATTITGSFSGSATTAGTVTTAAQPNITSVGTLTSVSSSGNVTGANLITGGIVSATGNITAPFFIGNGSQLTGLNTAGVSNGNSNVNIATANGNVTIAAVGNTTLTVTGTGANISGTLSATGNINAGNVAATTFTGALSGAATSATTAGTVTTAAQPNITSVGTLTSLSVSGNVNGGNLVTAGKVYSSEFINGGTGIYLSAGPSGYINFFTTGGDKATITDTGNIAASNLIANSTVFATTANVSGNVNAGNVSGTLLTGTLATAAQPNITSTGTLASLSVTGNVTAGNLVTGGILSVTGTGVSSIAGNLDMTSNNIVNLATPVNSTDAATKQYVDDVAQGLNIHDSCNAATTGTLATISGGTVTYNNGTAGVGATLTTTGSYTTIDGVTLSDGMRILVKNEVSAANNGIYVRTSSTVLTRATDFNSVPEVEAGDFTFVTAGTVYDNTGWVQTSTVTTIGTDAIDFVQFSGAGTYTAGTGLTLTGSVFSVNVAQPTITSVGTLTSLSVSGNANVGNIGAVAGVFTGNVTVGNIVSSGTGGNITGANVISANTFSASGNISAGNVSATTFTGSFSGSATTAGTVTTAAQGNITSVGTLTSLSVSGNVTAGNLNTAGAVVASTLTSNVATGTAPLTITSTTRVANLNVAYANVADIINVTAPGTGTGYVIFANATTGNVSEWTSSGITSNLANNSITATTFVGALSGAATTAGTVTTAAQGNITSVGTLTSLSVSGQITNGNITTGANTTAGNLTGNWTLSAGSRLQATYADLAEKYVADATYTPGTVLVFGGDQEVTLANAFDSTRVAGVVTTNPAYVMNSACEGEHVVNIALQGRAPVKVTGPVYKGDLLVSGSNGHATANNIARAGTIIGKSLENFNGESGIIEVAVGRF